MDAAPLLPEAAQQRILDTIAPGRGVTIPAAAARRRVLARAVVAPRNLPPFAQSAMDGYAIHAAGPVAAGGSFRLVGVSRAGGALPPPLQFGEAVRIFTGAPVPAGASLVAAQEICAEDGGAVSVSAAVAAAMYVRPAGSDVREGAVALPAGAVLAPASLGLLKALGVDSVDVHRPPRIALVASGDELQSAAAELGPGQVLESTSHALRWALEEEHLELQSFETARDDEGAHRAAFGRALGAADFLLVTGGVSVGDYDLVRPVLENLGVETVFWRVRQRPGGPLYFGRLGTDRYVFGLPGNPASTLTCFYEHVLPGLRRFLGWQEPRLTRVRAALGGEVRKPAGKTLFLRARLTSRAGELSVEPDPQQESHTLQSYAAANALAIFPSETLRFSPGEMVECDLLPGRPVPRMEPE